MDELGIESQIILVKRFLNSIKGSELHDAIINLLDPDFYMAEWDDDPKVTQPAGQCDCVPSGPALRIIKGSEPEWLKAEIEGKKVYVKAKQFDKSFWDRVFEHFEKVIPID